MDQAQLSHKWPQLKEKLKEEHPYLTEADLMYEIGKEEELLKRLQEKTGKTRKEIFNWLSMMG